MHFLKLTSMWLANRSFHKCLESHADDYYILLFLYMVINCFVKHFHEVLAIDYVCISGAKAILA